MQRIGIFGGTFNPIHLGHLRIAAEIRERLSLDFVIFIPSGNPPHKTITEVISAEHRLRMVQLAAAPYSFFKVSSIESERKGFSYSIDTISALQKEMGDTAEFYFIIGIDAFLEINTWKKADELLTMCNFVVIPRPGHRFAELKEVDIPPPLNPLPRGEEKLNEQMAAEGAMLSPSPLTGGGQESLRLPSPLRGEGQGGGGQSLSSDNLEKLDRGEITSLSIPLSGGYFLFLENIPLCDISSTELRKIIRNKGAVTNLLPETVMSYIMGQRLYLIDKKEDHTNR